MGNNFANYNFTWNHLRVFLGFSYYINFQVLNIMWNESCKIMNKRQSLQINLKLLIVLILSFSINNVLTLLSGESKVELSYKWYYHWGEFPLHQPKYFCDRNLDFKNNFLSRSYIKRFVRYNLYDSQSVFKFLWRLHYHKNRSYQVHRSYSYRLFRLQKFK